MRSYLRHFISCALLACAFYALSTMDGAWAAGTMKWVFTTATGGSSPAVGADGTTYVGSNDYHLYAVNPNGTQKWAFTTGNYVESSPAVGADGTIYVGSDDGNLYGVKPDGTQKWVFSTGGGVFSSPAVGTDGTIYVASEDGNLYAVKPDGTQKWSFTTYGSESSPAIGPDGTIYVGSEDGDLYAVKPDGTQKWYVWMGGSDSSPAIGADGTIYLGSVEGNLYAAKPDGTQKWVFSTGGGVFSSPAIGADGTIYVGSADKHLYAVKPDGTRKWAFTTGDIVNSSPAIGADGTIYVGSIDGNLYAVKPDGTRKWAFTTSGQINTSSPVIGPDGTIYVGSDGGLYAITSTSKGLAKSTWPMFRHDIRHSGRRDAVDFIESSLTGPPMNVPLGGRFTVTDIVKNQGDSLAAASVTRFYLSQSAVRNGSELLLTGSRSIPALKGWGSSMGKTTLTVPATVPLTQPGGSPGPYFLIACANDTGAAQESDPTNNCMASAGTVSVFAPDLVETSVSDPPAALASGNLFTVTDTVQNMGSVPVESTLTRYYLSTSQAKEASSILLTGSRSIPALPANSAKSSTGATKVTVLPGMPLGSYYLLACADDLGKIMEGSEANNCMASATQATVSSFVTADLEGTWQSNSLASGPDAPWWERGPWTIKSNGSFTFNLNQYPNGKPDRKSGVFSISNDGIVTLGKLSPYSQAAMNSDKTIIVGTNSWSADPGATTTLAVMTKKGSSYSLADLQGTWEVSTLASGPLAPYWERGPITFADAGGGYSGTLETSSGGSNPVSGKFSITSSGIMQRVPADTATCGMDANKSIVACTETRTDGGSDSTVLSVWTRKGDSYSSDDLTGLWEVNSMASGPGAPWWERGLLTILTGGTFSATYQQSDGTPVVDSGNIDIADDIVQMDTGTDLNTLCTMDSSKTVTVCTATWALGDTAGTTSLSISVKKVE